MEHRPPMEHRYGLTRHGHPRHKYTERRSFNTQNCCGYYQISAAKSLRVVGLKWRSKRRRHGSLRHRAIARRGLHPPTAIRTRRKYRSVSSDRRRVASAPELRCRPVAQALLPAFFLPRLKTPLLSLTAITIFVGRGFVGRGFVGQALCVSFAGRGFSFSRDLNPAQRAGL